MRLSRNGGDPDLTRDMTAFTDVIFQLVLFFVFSLKFLSMEGSLNAHLPAPGGGIGEAPPWDEINLSLDWVPQGAGAVTCTAKEYRPPDGGPPVENYTFPSAPAGVGPIPHEYTAPDLARVEAYLKSRKQYHERVGVGGGPLVNVHFNGPVPWQAIVDILDVCARVRIEEFSLGSAAPEN